MEPSSSKSAGLRHFLNFIAVLLVGVMLYLYWQRETQAQSIPEDTLLQPVQAQAQVEEEAPLQTPAFLAALDPSFGISRQVNTHTIFPRRPRVDVITYTVQTGDNLFAIAEEFKLEPETILWGNYETLEDNPQFLAPDQVLNILPLNGVYYQWQPGDTLPAIAAKFKADPEQVLNFTGNHFDLAALQIDPGAVEPGSWVIIPDGKREIKDWGPPIISRDNPASAAYYGPGHCGKIASGPTGTGSFVWPTVSREISGYNYSAIHRGIDFGGAVGNAVFAADTGVVVYAGWTNSGYGYLIVIDHGNGFQTAYAHLSSFNVGCGQSVYKGGVIGAVGSTGNSTGPHLHFELSYNGTKPNPLGYLR